MNPPRIARVAAVSLVLLGAIVVSIGLNTLINPPCASVRYFCPKAGCGALPQCPTTSGYAAWAAWGTPGAVLTAAGVVLYRGVGIKG